MRPGISTPKVFPAYAGMDSTGRRNRRLHLNTTDNLRFLCLGRSEVRAERIRGRTVFRFGGSPVSFRPDRGFRGMESRRFLSHPATNDYSSISNSFTLVGFFEARCRALSPLSWTYLFGTSINARSGTRDTRTHALIRAARYGTV